MSVRHIFLFFIIHIGEKLYLGGEAIGDVIQHKKAT